MKKYIVISNVLHNGKKYDKGSEIKQGDEGFEELVKAGIAQDPFASGKIEAEESQAEGEPVEQPVEQSKSVGKSKK